MVYRNHRYTLEYDPTFLEWWWESDEEPSYIIGPFESAGDALDWGRDHGILTE